MRYLRMDYESGTEWEEQESPEERERRARRRRMIAERKRRNRRRRMIYGIIRFFGPYAAGAAAVIFLITAGVKVIGGRGGEEENQSGRPVQESGEAIDGNVHGVNGGNGDGAEMGTADGELPEDGGSTENDGVQSSADSGAAAGGEAGGSGENAGEDKRYEAHATAATKQLGGELDSSYAIFIDAQTGEILAQKGADTIINPASMTKILTVLVAAEHVENLDDTFTITLNETDYSYVNECSNVGFAENEVVTVRDLFYGTILPSGGDAAAALAAYVAGTREAFVELMNGKLEELGLSDTAHVTNCVGLYDKNHYCTVYDMAMILQAALDNELCREVLNAHTYTTSATPQHPEGLLISNWFLRRIEDKDTGGEVLYAKTGYVAQAGSCAASYGEDTTGRGFVCVTADAGGSWKCIYDHVALYQEFAAKTQE